jgi:hypothetical protein
LKVVIRLSVGMMERPDTELTPYSASVHAETDDKDQATSLLLAPQSSVTPLNRGMGSFLRSSQLGVSVDFENVTKTPSNVTLLPWR